MSLRSKSAERAVLHEALGRDVEEIEPARRELPLDLILRAAILSRIQKGRLDAEIA